VSQKRPLAAVALVAVVVIGAGTARAASCVVGKLKAVGKKEAGLLKCQAKNAARPDPTRLSTCESRCMVKFGRACSKAGACAGDCSTCESNADSCETNVRAALGPNATLLKSASRVVKAEMRCYMKAAARSVAVDTGVCIPKAQAKFAGSVTLRTTVEQDCVDGQVVTDGGGTPPAGAVTDLCASTTTTSTTTTSTTTTTLVCCNVLVVGNQAGCFESTDVSCTGGTPGGVGTLCDGGTCGATRVVADSCCTYPGGCFEYSSASVFGDSACDGQSGTTTTGTTCDPSTGLCM